MFGKRIQLKLPPIRLRVLIMVLILLVGFVPVILKGAVLSNIYRQTLLDGRKNEIQNQSLILSARLTRSGYLRSAERDASLNAEMDATASAYNGRILLIDQNYRVIRDSFLKLRSLFANQIFRAHFTFGSVYLQTLCTDGYSLVKRGRDVAAERIQNDTDRKLIHKSTSINRLCPETGVNAQNQDI